jgi:hypothetical protein
MGKLPKDPVVTTTPTPTPTPTPSVKVGSYGKEATVLDKAPTYGDKGNAFGNTNSNDGTPNSVPPVGRVVIGYDANGNPQYGTISQLIKDAQDPKVLSTIRQKLIDNFVITKKTRDPKQILRKYQEVLVTANQASKSFDDWLAEWSAQPAIQQLAAGTGGPTAKQIKAAKESVKAYATDLGITIDDKQIASIANEYAAGGLSAEVVKSRIAQVGQIEYNKGAAATTVDSLKSTAAAYGIKYNDDFYRQATRSILDGSSTADTFAKQIKELAKSRYPSYAEQIDAGLTPDKIASPYMQTMASILELNPNDVSLNDPTISKALTSINAEGKPTAMPLWQFEQQLKQDPRWRYTNNAQQELMGTGTAILRKFGLMA